MYKSETEKHVRVISLDAGNDEDFVYLRSIRLVLRLAVVFFLLRVELLDERRGH